MPSLAAEDAVSQYLMEQHHEVCLEEVLSDAVEGRIRHPKRKLTMLVDDERRLARPEHAADIAMRFRHSLVTAHQARERGQRRASSPAAASRIGASASGARRGQS